MLARTSSLAMNNSISTRLLGAQTKYNDLQNQILSGYKIQKASDDPASASKIAIAKKQLNEYTMYSRSITSANLQINSMESALSQTTTKVERAAELVTQASSETNSIDSITPIKSELQELMKTIVMLANSQVDGQYIFSGANTTTPAYVIDDDGNVTYQGSSAAKDGTVRQLEISDGVYVPLNQSGDTIFGEYRVETDGSGNETVIATGLFGTIGKAIAAMNGVLSDPSDPTSEVVPDYSAIRAQIDEVAAEVNNISTVRAQFGSYAQRIEMTKNSIEENEILVEDRRSQLQDVDLLKAISDLTYQDYVLQASMKISTGMLGTSLLNYL